MSASRAACFLIALFVAAGCGDKTKSRSSSGRASGSARAASSSETTGAGSASAPATSSAPAATLDDSAQVQPNDASKLTVKYTGKANADGYLLFNITNDTGKVVRWWFNVFYAYDKDGKQLDFKPPEKSARAGAPSVNDIPPGKKVTEALAIVSADLPPGTVYVQTVTTQVTDPMGEVIYQASQDPPDAREMVR